MDGLTALDRLLAFNAKGDAHTISVETQMTTIRNFALSRMVSTLEATNPRFFGLVEDAHGIEAIRQAIRGIAAQMEHFGVPPGSPAAKRLYR